VTSLTVVFVFIASFSRFPFRKREKKVSS